MKGIYTKGKTAESQGEQDFCYGSVHLTVS